MKVYLKFIAILSLFTGVLCFDNIVSADAQYSGYHVTSEGIEIISHTNNWNNSNIKTIEEELKNNIHGSEIEYLARIEIKPGLEPGGNKHVSASYHKEQHSYDIPVNLTGFLPEDYSFTLNMEKGVITIYQGDEKETIEDVAMDISHEYGHHYTFFYFGDDFGSSDNFKESDYYRIRQLNRYESVNGSTSYESEIHRWSIFEIAAEDYKQLMGSQTFKKPVDYKDISDKMGSETYRPVNPVSLRDYNAMPQENWDIPLATQVEGLAEYFFSFIEEEAHQIDSSSVEIPPLSFERRSNHGFEHFLITWEPHRDIDGIVYTLVGYDEDFSTVVGVKTVFDNEEPRAVIGTVTREEGNLVYYYQDKLDSGIRHFRLYMQLADGSVYAGETYTIDFN